MAVAAVWMLIQQCRGPLGGMRSRRIGMGCGSWQSGLQSKVSCLGMVGVLRVWETLLALGEPDKKAWLIMSDCSVVCLGEGFGGLKWGRGRVLRKHGCSCLTALLVNISCVTAAVSQWGGWFVATTFAAILVWEEVWDLPNTAYLSGWLLLIITGKEGRGQGGEGGGGRGERWEGGREGEMGGGRGAGGDENGERGVRRGAVDKGGVRGAG